MSTIDFPELKIDRVDSSKELDGDQKEARKKRGSFLNREALADSNLVSRRQLFN